MVIIGLTGNIGVGKSRVIAYLAQKGALTLDADRLAREAIEPGMPAHNAVVAAFGPAILRADGAVDRAALGAIVFADRARLEQLESIVHPAVFHLALDRLDASRAPVAVIEAIKLLEARRILQLCDEVWVVTASEETQLRRLMESRGMSVEEARQRLAAQSSQADKVRQATRVIDNDGTLAELYAQLDAIWADLVAKYNLEIVITDNG